MRKAIRRTLVALWCLLSLGLALLWVRSSFRQDQFVYARAGGRLWQLFCNDGEFGVSTATPWPNAEPAQFFSLRHAGGDLRGGPKWLAGPRGRQADWEGLGVHVVSGPGVVPLKSDGTASWSKDSDPPFFVLVQPRRFLRVAPLRFVDTYVSFGLPAVLLAAVPAFFVLRRVQQGRRQRLARRDVCLCPICGYDIRATPDSDGPLWDRCPECGWETRAAKLTPPDGSEPWKRRADPWRTPRAKGWRRGMPKRGRQQSERPASAVFAFFPSKR